MRVCLPWATAKARIARWGAVVVLAPRTEVRRPDRFRQLFGPFRVGCRPSSAAGLGAYPRFDPASGAASSPVCRFPNVDADARACYQTPRQLPSPPRPVA
jgi:hypothetical protein